MTFLTLGGKRGLSDVCPMRSVQDNIDNDRARCSIPPSSKSTKAEGKPFRGLLAVMIDSKVDKEDV
jgi:hypothetical protein